MVNQFWKRCVRNVNELAAGLEERSRREAKLAALLLAGRVVEAAPVRGRLEVDSLTRSDLFNDILEDMAEWAGVRVEGVPADGPIFAQMRVFDAQLVLTVLKRLVGCEVMRDEIETRCRAAPWTRTARLLSWIGFPVPPEVYTTHVRIRFQTIPAWLLAIAGVFVVVVLFLSEGLTGLQLAAAVIVALAMALSIARAVLSFAAVEHNRSEVPARRQALKDLDEYVAKVAAAQQAAQWQAMAAAAEGADAEPDPEAAVKPVPAVEAAGSVADAFGQLPLFNQLLNNTRARGEHTKEQAFDAMLSVAANSAQV